MATLIEVLLPLTQVTIWEREDIPTQGYAYEHANEALYWESLANTELVATPRTLKAARQIIKEMGHTITLPKEARA